MRFGAASRWVVEGPARWAEEVRKTRVPARLSSTVCQFESFKIADPRTRDPSSHGGNQGRLEAMLVSDVTRLPAMRVPLN